MRLKMSSFNDELSRRRERYARSIGHPCLIIIDAASEKFMCPHNEYRYRQDSDFYYLTGFPEPEAILLMFVTRRLKIDYHLFVRSKDPSKEIWTGQREGQEGAISKYGANDAHPIEQSEEYLYQFIMKSIKLNFPVYFSSHNSESPSSKMIDKLKNIILFTEDNKQLNIKQNLFNALVPLHKLRLIKTPYEIDLLRKVCQISSDAHTQLMIQSRVGMNEYALDGLFTGYVMQNGCPRIAYPNIVGSGSNATILHYEKNNKKIKDGDLVLVDAGGELEGYAADITRTWPINGRFTKEQREIYELVLSVQKKCIDSVSPGVNFKDLQQLACDMFGEGLINLGIIRKTNKETVCKFYMHNLGHFLGMDVHDCLTCDYKDVILLSGMVITIEPGLYFSPYLVSNTNVNGKILSKYSGIGVRIEHDILVTNDGCEVLSLAPKEITDILKECN
jgi:Xaa-Pro aminopeptidase